ncbi:hypothetical protein N7454_008392 [Penicillium verhagenii]|nr:hypothetical protein N7454_008392 [Penicillium verhagenii]
MPVSPTTSIVGDNPVTTNCLNACAFQQSALTTVGQLQYAAFYSSTHPSSAVRYVTIARRNKRSEDAQWVPLTFTDYDQTTDDGHNTISIGVCPHDGTIHIAFDHHCSELKYRVSRPGLADDSRSSSWTPAAFGPTLNNLPTSAVDVNSALVDVTYPRFIRANRGLFFECRIGKAGAGSDVLYFYDPMKSHFELRGKYLIGRNCNPYPNGLSFHHPSQSLHVTWTNRHFVDYEGADDEESNLHKAQAGPNGPENNEGLYHSYSRDFGTTWHGTGGEIVGVLSQGSGMDSQDSRLRAREIPQGSGIMNQEAQFVDTGGYVHVLNRQRMEEGETWIHYYCRGVFEGWTATKLRGVYPTPTGPRGKIVSYLELSTIFFILPGGENGELAILRASLEEQSGSYNGYEIVWRGYGYWGEPLVDEEALDEGILSFLIIREQKVVVVDFEMDTLVK